MSYSWSSIERVSRDWAKLCHIVKLSYCQFGNNDKISHGIVSYVRYRIHCSFENPQFVLRFRMVGLDKFGIYRPNEYLKLVIFWLPLRKKTASLLVSSLNIPFINAVSQILFLQNWCSIYSSFTEEQFSILFGILNSLYFSVQNVSWMTS